MAAIDIIQGAADLLGIPRPSSITATDVTTRQLLALLQEEGDELSRRHDWRALIVPAQVVGDGASTSFDLPADFQRLATGPALWRDQTLIEPLTGPLNSAEWIAYTNSISAGVQKVYRLIGGTLDIYPALGADEVVRLEYFSSHWVISADTLTRRLGIAQDDDFPAMPERLLKLGLRWRWRMQKGLPYEAQQLVYQSAVEQEAFADRAYRAVTMGRSPEDDLAPLLTPDTISL